MRPRLLLRRGGGPAPGEQGDVLPPVTQTYAWSSPPAIVRGELGGSMRRSTALTSIVILAGLVMRMRKRQQRPPLRTVDHVDLGRYAGTWYEIALFPKRYERGCTRSAATYTLRDDGGLHVRNECRVGSLDGPVRSVEGRARVVDPKTNAKLEVRFFWPFWGAYWIIDLGADYEYAVVGHPSRESLWILSRTPQMPEAVYQAILRRLDAQGYDTRRLVRTPQVQQERPRPSSVRSLPLPDASDRTTATDRG